MTFIMILKLSVLQIVSFSQWRYLSPYYFSSRHWYHRQTVPTFLELIVWWGGQMLTKPQNNYLIPSSLFNLHLHTRVWSFCFPKYYGQLQKNCELFSSHSFSLKSYISFLLYLILFKKNVAILQYTVKKVTLFFIQNKWNLPCNQVSLSEIAIGLSREQWQEIYLLLWLP